MKKFLLGLLMICMCGLAYATGPAIEEAEYLQFTAADQETSATYVVYAIAWVEDDAANTDIAADDDLTIENAAGIVVLSKRGAAAGDELIINFPQGLTIVGIKAEDLDGGILYIYGKRK